MNNNLMKMIEITPESAPQALRALAMVAGAAKTGIRQPHRAFLNAVQASILKTDFNIDELAEIATPGTGETLRRCSTSAPACAAYGSHQPG